MKKTNKLLSIDFGQSSVKIAYINHKGGKFRVLNYDSLKMPQGRDDRAATLEFIKGFLRNNSIPARDAFLSVRDAEKIFIKYLVLAAVPDKEMLEAIKWQLKPELGFDANAAVFDWQVVKEYNDEEGVKKDGSICIAAEKSFIDKYLSITGECGLAAAGVSTAAFDYENILTALPEKPAVTAVLDMDSQQAGLFIYKDNKLAFVRSLLISSDKLAQSLTGTLVSDKGKIELSLEQAQGLIERFGIPLDETAVLEGNIKGIHIISLMRPFLEGLAREIKRSFDYFSSSFKEEAPAGLYITGGGAGLKNLDIYLNKEISIKVAELPLPERIDISAVKERLNNDPNRITGLIAAAMAQPEGINLLPHEIKTKKRESYQKAFLRLISIVSAAIFLFFFLVFRAEIADYRKRLKAANTHLQAITEVKVLKRRIELKEGLVHKIKLGKVPVGGLLALISHITPGNIELEELSLDQDNHILVLKGLVSAVSNTAEAELTEFIKVLESSSFFKEATLISSQNISGTQKFEIDCELNY